MPKKFRIRRWIGFGAVALLIIGSALWYIGVIRKLLYQEITESSVNKIAAYAGISYCVILAMLLASVILYWINNERHNQRIEQLAFYDVLTGMHNQNYFKVHGQALLSEMAGKGAHAVVVFDVVNFKLINDTAGYSTGDWVLRYIADEVQTMLTAGEECAKSHNDLFEMILAYEDKAQLCQRIEQLFEKISSTAIAKIPSIGNFGLVCGIYVIEDYTIPMAVMTDAANMARKDSKRKSMGRIAFYDDAMRRQLLQQKEIEDSMEWAMQNGEFIVYLQPKVDLHSEKILGAEVLVRWQHGDELRSPVEFIPLFESNGFIERLDYYLFECVCQLKHKWQEQGLSALVLSVNMSRIHLKCEKFTQDLVEIAQRYQVPFEQLEIEMTETLFFEDNDQLINVMKQIKSAGFQLAIDDFGAGYSSLNLLKEIPADVLKLDREFLGRSSNNKNGKTVIGHIVSMAKDLKMQVVSEGVETTEQVDFLKSIGCEMAQGFFYARPMPVAEFEAKYLYGK